MTLANPAATSERHPAGGINPPDGAPKTGKHIVLTTFGSFGDLHPYMAVALELKERGHRPVIATGDYYQEKIEAAGIEFHAVRPDLPPLEEAAELVAKIMDVKTGAEFLFKELLSPYVQESYDDLCEATRGADLLLTHVATLTGPIVAQKTGIPWISSVLAPTSFFSIHDPLVPPLFPQIVHLLRLHPSIARTFVRLTKRLTASWVENVYRLRADLGLPRGEHPIFEGQHSLTMVLAMFSKALGEAQPDWPRQTLITGFPFYDRKDAAGMPPALEQFLDDGPAPIVFTLGSSAIFAAGDFYQQSILAAHQLKRRAVLLIGDAVNMPAEPLPDGIVAFEYAPYGEILPRAAAIVHQGGVGTTGQAMRAGVPMLVVPFNHDQPDNAMRIARLGVGRSLTRNHYKAKRVAAELNQLLSEPRYARKAAAVGQVVRSEDGARAAADAIESILKNVSSG
ncbi:MAG TPA: glycosyltransferase [Pyrinomonadaceae bacterium]|jgi:MGT family glycosyltransferase